jgi:DNA-binding winged helix-turn-helix (wHTH) protein/RecA/RadA recombinase
VSGPRPAAPSLVLDLAAGRLQVDDRSIELRPKTWEVLCALAERAGELVTKNELLDRVWPDTAVSEGILNKSIGELRAALDDSRGEPRCIETVPRRGYRWIGRARIVPRGSGGSVAAAGPPEAAPPSARSELLTPTIVARDDDLARLDAVLARARSGRRQVVFVTGEAGAGKTTVVDHFVTRAGAAGTSVLVLHGQCLETSGLYEPYLPLLDGFERLARDPATADTVVPVLQRFAPAWVAQIASLAPPRDPSATTAPGSMLRELATVIDELARDRTVVVVLEDAHWADFATTDAIGALAKRRDAARLLVVVTERKAEALALDHPVIGVERDLVSRGVGEEIALVPFAGVDLRAYVAARCPGLEARGEIAMWLLQQTAGNPLFVRLVLDEWIARGMVEAGADGVWAPVGEEEEMRRTVPDSLRALLERQLAALAAEERSVLEAASVRIGAFHAAQIAAAVAMDVDDADSLCESIARRGQLLRASGEIVGADGRLAEQYVFLHATVQSVVAAGLPSTRRRRFHRAAAAQLEQEYVGRLPAVASVLAVHYEAAGETIRAAFHLREAGRQAMTRDAPRDAITTLENALDLIDANPGLPDGESVRVLVMVYLTHARQLAYGFIDSQVAELWSRTSKLAEANEDATERLVADSGSIVVACVAGRYAEAEDLIRASLPRLDVVEEGGVRKTFFFAAGCTRYRIAMMADSCAMFEAALATSHDTDPIPGADMNALLMSQYAPAVALAGRPDYVRELAEQSMARASVHSHYSECVTGTLASWALAMVGDYEAATPIAARCFEIAEADNFRTWTTRPLFVLGMADILEGRVDQGIVKVRAGLEGRRGDGQLVDHSAMCCMFAEALLDAGRAGAADLLKEAADFVATSGELFAETEILRLEARMQRETGAEAAAVEQALRRALELAQLRGIRWHALRAATDLADLLVESGRREEAEAVLAPAAAAIAGGERLAAMRCASETLERCRTVAACA